MRKISSNIVGVGKNRDENLAIRDAINYLPIENLINSDDCVVIVANFVNMNPPDKAVIVGPQSLKEVINIVKEKCPKRLVIAGGSASTDTNSVINEFSFDKIIKDENVEFVDLNKGPYTNLYLGGNVIKETKINKIINEATIIISFTQLKHHEEAAMSASIKNIALSFPPAEIHGYPKKNLGIHDDLHDFIYRMGKTIPIDLSILSLNPAMVGTGPSKGIAVKSGIVLAGLDSVAVDTIGARLLGFKPQAVNYLFNLIKDKIGEGNIENIDLKGDKLANLEKEFSKLAYGTAFSVDE
ncbi:MAG: DUF362 domain-containing protein [Clostridiaceae bacterium]